MNERSLKLISGPSAGKVVEFSSSQIWISESDGGDFNFGKSAEAGSKKSARILKTIDGWHFEPKVGVTWIVDDSEVVQGRRVKLKSGSKIRSSVLGPAIMFNLNSNSNPDSIPPQPLPEPDPAPEKEPRSEHQTSEKDTSRSFKVIALVATLGVLPLAIGLAWATQSLSTSPAPPINIAEVLEKSKESILWVGIDQGEFYVAICDGLLCDTNRLLVSGQTWVELESLLQDFELQVFSTSLPGGSARVTKLEKTPNDSLGVIEFDGEMQGKLYAHSSSKFIEDLSNRQFYICGHNIQFDKTSESHSRYNLPQFIVKKIELRVGSVVNGLPVITIEGENSNLINAAIFDSDGNWCGLYYDGLFHFLDNAAAEENK